MHILCAGISLYAQAQETKARTLQHGQPLNFHRKQFMINALMELPSDVASDLDAAD